MTVTAAPADARCPQILQGSLAHHHRAFANPLVSSDFLPASAADRERAGAHLSPNRLDPDHPGARRRHLQHPGRPVRRLGRPQGPADGGVAVLDRRALPADGLHPRLLAAADLRRPGRHRQQSLAPDRDPAAGAALSRPQGPGRVDPRHGRQCRRRARAAGRRRAARGADLARGRDHQRDPRHRDVGGAAGAARPHADGRRSRRGDAAGAEAHACRHAARLQAAARQPHADLPVRGLGVPLDDARRADDLPAALSRDRHRLFAVLDRRLHGGAADRRLHRVPDRRASLRQDGPPPDRHEQHGDDRGDHRRR